MSAMGWVGTSLLTNIIILLCTRLAAANPCYTNTTTCTPINSTMCLTAKATYTHTSLLFTNYSQSEINEQLEVWSHLKRVPECWAVIQPFLCSVYLPQCDATKQKVELPNRELCERVRTPCEVVTRDNKAWPTFLQCDQWFYAQSCGKTFFEGSNFDTVGECASPLTETSEEANWYDKIKGCGIQCENPLYTKSEHTAAHAFVAVMGSLSLGSTLFTLVTFIIDWKVARKYPAVILFFINGCFFLGSLGWMAQFIGRDDIVCRKDGTIRKGEPLIGSGETASCTVVYIIVYYFMMAGVVWYVMLTYSWDITFKALGTVRDDLSKKTAYFHIISWCLPLVLTIVGLSISEIDADSLSGICFPGYYNNWVRVGFVLAPIGLVLIIGIVFSVKGLVTLVKVRKDSPQFIGDRATAKIRETIVRLGIFTVLVFVFVLIMMSVHLYTFTNERSWEESLNNYTYCQANVSVIQMLNNETTSSCEMENRPSIMAAIIHIFAFFAASIAMSSWAWTKASLEAWERLFRKLCNKPVNKPQQLRKHRMVKRTFKRRKKRKNERLSVSYGTDHDDPVGMKFDLSSMSSQSLSSGFAVAVPKHSRRHRRGMMSPMNGTRRYSDSDLGSLASRMSSQRQSSRSSRPQSYESSMSQKLSDIERDIREEERRKRRRKRRKKRQNRIQPILEPISSQMAAMQDRRARQLRSRHRHRSDSSDLSRASAHGVNVAVDKNTFVNESMGTSNILSDSVTTDGNSISEIILPPHHQKHPDFSMFTANTMLPLTENKGDNSNGNTTNLKGAKSSPSGSFRRGRRREVKLEMTETSFYQEDDDNIEMGGNQTIHREENCHETGEISQADLKELGPLVTEIFEQARANSASGSRNSANGRSSGQRDPMGSGRIGSASSRGSRGSRGSQSNSKDLIKYATTKVCLPDKPSHETSHRGHPKRPFSGDYVLVSKRNSAKHEPPIRKSQSQPGSRVSSASDHKRQIGYNGRLGFGDGLSWSRFLQSKGHVPGQIFTQPHFLNQYKHLDHGVIPGKLQILDKDQVENQNKFVKHGDKVDILDIEGEQKHRLKREYGFMPNKAIVPDVLDVEGEHTKQLKNNQSSVLNSNPDKMEKVNVLNIEEEQKQNLIQKLGSSTKRKVSDPAEKVDVLNVEDEHKRKLKHKQQSAIKGENVNVLNVEAEQLSRRNGNNYGGSASSGTRTSDMNSGSASSRNSRQVRYDGLQSAGSASTTSSRYNRRLDESSILPGVERNANVYNLIDYEVDDDYDDFTDELTDTYTYTSYDDDLTEVSSLPC